ncbi:MAG: FdtA/QdtA family cupin domain-containing protein [Leeuwenhoekiella sp.]
MKPYRIKIPKIEDRRGNLAVIEKEVIPFVSKRVYYLFDVPSGASRGGHAHKNLKQFLIALSGSFDVILDDGTSKTTHTLNRPDEGLLIPSGYWRELENFSSAGICLVLASEEFDEEDYIREYDEYLTYKNKPQ